MTLSSLGVSSDHVGFAFGRFDLVVPAIPGSPVYRQAHSAEIKTNKKFLLYRWEKSHPPLLPNRSKDEWLVGEETRAALLKAPVGVDPNKPPSFGWQFNNNEKFEEDASIICNNQPELPCSITVSLSSEERLSFCQGRYESTGLISMGRQVISVYFNDPFTILH